MDASGGFGFEGFRRSWDILRLCSHWKLTISWKVSEVPEVPDGREWMLLDKKLWRWWFQRSAISWKVSEVPELYGWFRGLWRWRFQTFFFPNSSWRGASYLGLRFFGEPVLGIRFWEAEFQLSRFLELPLSSGETGLFWRGILFAFLMKALKHKKKSNFTTNDKPELQTHAFTTSKQVKNTTRPASGLIICNSKSLFCAFKMSFR